jgi:SAM-dependent methyltransferase
VSLIDFVQALAKPLLSDRVLPPVPGTPPEAFEALYAGRQDPWGVLASPLADRRYLALVEVVSQFSPCRSILDVGCGEGALTRYLAGCATKVTGIDASPTAIERARRLVPRATFHSSTLEAFGADRVFDVVLAVEVLYYVESIDVAIEKLLTLGRNVIISYTNRERRRLEPHVAAHCPLARCRFHPFFGLSGFGFTIAQLTPRLSDLRRDLSS